MIVIVVICRFGRYTSGVLYVERIGRYSLVPVVAVAVVRDEVERPINLLHQCSIHVRFIRDLDVPFITIFSRDIDVPGISSDCREVDTA
jgi:hypothetical protein